MRLLPALLVALLPGVSLATGYYVNDTTTVNDVVLPGCSTVALGADVNTCGTCASPCRTPNYLYARAPLAPGDIVYFNAGTYTETTAVPVLNLSNAAKAGTAGAPVIFRGVLGTNGLPVTLFDGNNVATAGVQVQTSWVSVENIAVTRTSCLGTSAPFGSGFQVASTAIIGISLVNVEVYGTNCTFGAPIDFDSIANPCTGCRIVGSTLHDNGTTAGGIYTAGAGGILVQRNVIFRNTLTDASLPGIVLSGTPGAVVEGNLVFGNGGAALAISKCAGCGASTNVTVRGNTFWGNQQASAGSSVAEITVTQQASVTLEHNLVGASTRSCLDLDATSSLLRSDYNDYFPFPMTTAQVGAKGGSSGATLAAWQAATGQDSNSLSVLPLFVSATDFHLKSAAGRPGPSGTRVFDTETSPVIDRADPAYPVGLEPAPNGGRANLGAYGGTDEASLTPVTLAMVRGDQQTGDAGVPLPVPLEVVVSSQPTRAEPGVGVRFTVTAPATGTLSVATALTDASGKASTVITPGPGLNQVVAELINVGGAPALTFTVTGVTAVDAGSTVDAGGADAGEPDAGSPDAGAADAGAEDAGLPDAGSTDAGSEDAGLADAGLVDAGLVDAGTADAGTADAGFPDAGSEDAGSPDAGSEDAGSSPDGGTGFVPIVDLGCGCQSGGGSSLFGLLLLWYRSRRRAR